MDEQTEAGVVGDLIYMISVRSIVIISYKQQHYKVHYSLDQTARDSHYSLAD